ncbi:MAG: ComF family protein [Deltaproteobacteria bacterium]|nr:MAG: ComF family protein [Deltaproteobacteria bacterium]
MVQFFNAFLDFFFPPRCLICERDIINAQSQGICEPCLSSIRYISSPVCLKCGIPFNSVMGSDHLCGTCLTSRVYFTKARAVGVYEGVLQEAIHRLKYNKKTLLAKPLGALMAGTHLGSIDFKSYDFLIPVPLHFKRLRERGFNQALSLARYIGKRRRIPIDYMSLKRIKWESPQINLSKEERERNVKGVFSLSNESRFKDKSILLVDDVYTSGATVNECARVLTKAKTGGVDVLTLCRAV